MDNATLLKDIGRLQGEMEAVHRELQELRKSTSELAHDTREIASLLDQAKGGKRYVMAMIAVSASISATITAVASWVHWGPK